MKPFTNSKTLFFIAFILISFVTDPNKTIKVYLIGDSTMSIKDVNVYPETGWGMPFATFFDNTVIVDNRAKNGRSTRTFLSENLWNPIYENLQEGDYVFIQFGHNDESKEKIDRYTTPDQFRLNIEQFVKDTRSKKANPILITAVARRKFDSTNHIVDGHGVYTKIIRELSAELNLPLIDLQKSSTQLLEKMGEDDSKLLFLQLEKGEHPNYPNGKIDNTHFNELGARKMAQLVLADLIALKLDLVQRIRKPKVK